MSIRSALLAAACLVAACHPAGTPPSPIVEDAWVREAPPGAGMTAGYFTLVNPTDAALRLVAVRSDAFDSIELHATVNVDGVARMRRESEVTVPARDSLVFSPGGRHLMLFGPRRPLVEGDTVDLVLEIADGTELAATARVSRGGADRRGH